MNYKVATIANFRKEAKKLAKKYHSLKNDLKSLSQQLAENPTTGTALGNNCFKLRMAITSKGKGKSGGARIITHFYVSEKTVFLLSIYDKSVKQNISDKEIQTLVHEISD